MDGAPNVAHKTLSLFYPRLTSLLAHLVASVPISAADLLHDADPPAYRALLLQTLCAADSAHHEHIGRGPGGHEGTQQDAIDRLLSAASRRGGSNVLVPKMHARDSGHVNVARPGVTPDIVMSISTTLRQVEWRVLPAGDYTHELTGSIGDGAFNHLLLSASLFLPLGNNNFVQLCGVPIHNRPLLKRSADDAAAAAAAAPGPDVPRRPAKRCKGVADIILSRQNILYGRAPMADGKIVHGLPKSHTLNKLCTWTDTPTDQQCVDLLLDVFKHERAFRNATRRAQMVAAARELLSRHRRVKYGALYRQCVDRGRDPKLEDMLRLISHSQVCRFLVAVLRRLVPPAVMGSEHNFGVIASRVRELVRIKMHEQMNLHALVQNVRVNDVAWLCVSGPTTERVTAAEATKRRALVESFVFWLFEAVLIPLLRASFYATETADTRYETVYYAHADWMRATAPHFRKLEGGLLTKLGERERAEYSRGPLGVAGVRLIPKPNGFRPIVNLGRQKKITNALGVSVRPGKAISANQLLRPVHQILMYEKDRHKAELGSTLFGTNEIFAPVQALKRELLSLHGRMPRLYFAKMDIQAAFDTIQQAKMVDIVRDLVKDDDYYLATFNLLLPPSSGTGSRDAKQLWKTRAVAADELWQEPTALAAGLAQSMRNAVVVDGVSRRAHKSATPISPDAQAKRIHKAKADMLALVRAHVERNVWQVGRRLYRQAQGIPQGSVISSLLCSFCYAALEREHLGFVRRPGTRLLRYIDDFLLVTDDYGTARRFVQTMLRGFPAYGAFVSRPKTLLSFEYAADGFVAPVCGTERDGGQQMPYCGFRIDSRSLDLSIDTPRMLSTPARQSFALRSSRHRGAAFAGWLTRQLENRNHVAFLDTAHNRMQTVHVNVFVNFALAAMKAPHYFAGALDARRSRIVADALVAAAEYTYVAGRARVRHAARGDGATRHFAVRKRDFMRLAFEALCRVLGRKGARFRGVVLRLRGRAAGWPVDAAVDRAISVGWEQVKDARF